MSDLKRLKEIGAAEIYKKTHISIEETNAILQKNFAYFNRTKALGFIKILEREYGVNLSSWVEEFEEYYQANTQDSGIFVSAKEEEKSPIKLLLILIVILLGIIGYIFISMQKPAVAPVQESSSVIEEAKDAVAKNIELEQSKPVVEEKEPEVVKPDEPSFYVESNKDLWIGVYYNDIAEREGNVSKGVVPLDPNRNQIITLGHGQFKLVFNGEVIEPKSENLYRYRLRDGVLTQMSTPVITPKADNNQSEKQ